eukprot:65245-Chlamydomonas_euryale.AAC.2
MPAKAPDTAAAAGRQQPCHRGAHHAMLGGTAAAGTPRPDALSGAAKRVAPGTADRSSSMRRWKRVALGPTAGADADAPTQHTGGPPAAAAAAASASRTGNRQSRSEARRGTDAAAAAAHPAAATAAAAAEPPPASAAPAARPSSSPAAAPIGEARSPGRTGSIVAPSTSSCHVHKRASRQPRPSAASRWSSAATGAPPTPPPPPPGPSSSSPPPLPPPPRALLLPRQCAPCPSGSIQSDRQAHSEAWSWCRRPGSVEGVSYSSAAAPRNAHRTASARLHRQRSLWSVHTPAGCSAAAGRLPPAEPRLSSFECSRSQAVSNSSSAPPGAPDDGTAPTLPGPHICVGECGHSAASIPTDSDGCSRSTSDSSDSCRQPQPAPSSSTTAPARPGPSPSMAKPPQPTRPAAAGGGPASRVAPTAMAAVGSCRAAALHAPVEGSSASASSSRPSIPSACSTPQYARVGSSHVDGSARSSEQPPGSRRPGGHANSRYACTSAAAKCDVSDAASWSDPETPAEAAPPPKTPQAPTFRSLQWQPEASPRRSPRRRGRERLQLGPQHWAPPASPPAPAAGTRHALAAQRSRRFPAGAGPQCRCPPPPLPPRRDALRGAVPAAAPRASLLRHRRCPQQLATAQQQQHRRRRRYRLAATRQWPPAATPRGTQSAPPPGLGANAQCGRSRAPS